MKFAGKGVWRARLVSTGALALGLAGVMGLGATAASAAAGPGYLRLGHLSTNAPPVDVYLYSFGNASALVVLHHVGYGDVSQYEQVASGEYTVAMRAAGAAPASKPVLSTTIDVLSGHAYTVAGMGPLAGLRLQGVASTLGVTAPTGGRRARARGCGWGLEPRRAAPPPPPGGSCAGAAAAARPCMPGDLTTRSGRPISPLLVVRRPAAAIALIAGVIVAGVGVTGLAL